MGKTPGAITTANDLCQVRERLEVCESRSFFQCSEEGGRYFWRNAAFRQRLTSAYESKFELLSNPPVRNDCVEPNGGRDRQLADIALFQERLTR